MTFSRSEIETLRQMIEYYDEILGDATIPPECSELIGVIRFKVMTFLRDEKESDTCSEEDAD